MRIWDASASATYATIYFTEIERLFVELGPGGNQLLVTAGQTPTEMVFTAPLRSQQGMHNTARLVAASRAVVLNGTWDEVSIGPELGSRSPPVRPRSASSPA